MTTRTLHISRGISKLGQSIPSVSLPAVLTCRPDAPCFATCYARKGRFRFSNVAECLQNNLDLWREDPEKFERELIASCCTSLFFRYHSSGDIPDERYLNMMVRVANACPKTSFLCFTKKYDLVDSWMDAHGTLPGNLSIVYSAWGNFVPENPHGMPMAYIRFKNEETPIPETARPCSGYCGACVQTNNSCWTLRRNQNDSVVFNQH